MSHKRELLAAIRESRTDLEQAVNAYGGRLDAETGDDWTVRDAVAHIALWERMAVRKLAGTPLPIGEEIAGRKPWNLDAFNEAMRSRLRTLSDEQVLTEFAEAHRALMSAVEAAADEDCAPKGRVWQVVDEDAAGHYHYHFRCGTRWRSAGRWRRGSGLDPIVIASPHAAVAPHGA
jgi:Mycothiol maleylpyruvate isomerase N-terminal domain